MYHYFIFKRNSLSEFEIAMSYYIPTYLDSCVYYRSGCLQRNQHKQHHRTVEQDSYMSLTYSVILLHKSRNMMPSLSNRPSHRQLENKQTIVDKARKNINSASSAIYLILINDIREHSTNIMQRSKG